MFFIQIVIILGALGQKAGTVVGTMLFGPAGGITGAIVGAFAGVSQGGRLSTGVKRMFSKKQEHEMVASAVNLINKVIPRIDQKVEIKKHKVDAFNQELMDSEANKFIRKDTERRCQEDIKYLINKKNELITLSSSLKNRSVNIIEVLPEIMSVITKSGVHPIHFQNELQLVQQKAKEYMKKV